MNTTPYQCYSSKFSHKETVYAYNAREAAEKFTSIIYNFYNEKFSSVDVEVKEANNHYAETMNYHVQVDIQPVFNAHKVNAWGYLDEHF